MPLHATETTIPNHAVDPRSSKQSGGAPRSWGKLHTPDYPDTLPSRPKSTREAPHGEEKALKTEVKLPEELKGSMKEYLNDGLLKLLEMRKSRSRDQFVDLLVKSGHGDYLTFFDKLTVSQAGTGIEDRSRGIDNAALDEFMENKRGVKMLYEMMRDDLAEQAMLAGIKSIMDPNSPRPGDGIRDQSITIQVGGPLREAARGAKYFFRKPVGHPYGRGEGYPGLDIQNRGDVAVVVSGVAIAVGTVGSFIATPLGGALLAAGTIAVEGGIIGLMHAARKGETLKLEIDKSAIQSVLGDPKSPTSRATAANPALIEWLEDFSGLGADYQVTRQRRGIIPGLRMLGRRHNVSQRGPDASAVVGRSLVSDNELRDNVVGLATLLKQFQEENSIRPENQGAFNPADWLLDESLTPPSHPTPFDRDVLKEFLREQTMPDGRIYRDGVFDRRGRPLEIARGTMTGGVFTPDRTANGGLIWMRNPDFNRGNEGVDRVGNVTRYFEARKKVRERQLNMAFQEIIDGKTDVLDTTLKDIAERRKTTVGASGEKAEKRKKELEESSMRLGKDKAALDNEATAIKTYKDKIVESRADSVTLRQELEALAESVDIVGWAAPPAPRPTVAEVQNALQKMLQAGVATEIVIGSERIGSIPDERQQIQADKRSLYDLYFDDHVQPSVDAVVQARADLAGATPRTREILQQALADARAQESAQRSAATEFLKGLEEDPQFVERVEEATARRKIVTDLIAEMRDKAAEIRRSETQRTIAVADSRRETISSIAALQTARNTIEGWTIAAAPPLPGIDLSTQELATQTFDILLGRVNAAYVRDASLGWPADQTTEEQRVTLVNAMAEARALRQINSPVRHFADVIDPAIWGITEGQLVNPAFDVAVAMNLRSPAIGGRLPLNAAEIDVVRQAAQVRRDIGRAIDPSIWNIGQADIDLLALSAQDIQDRMTKRAAVLGVGAPAVPNLALIERMQGEVSRQLTIRQRAVEQVAKGIGDQVERIDKEKAQVAEKGLSSQLDAIERHALRYGEIRRAVTEDYPTRDDLDKLLSIEPTTAENYDSYELGQTQAKINMMRLAFDHTHDTGATYEGEKGTEAAFRRNEALEMERRFCELLADRFNLGLSIPSPLVGGPPTIIRVTDFNMAVQLLRVGIGLQDNLIPPLLIPGVGFTRGRDTIRQDDFKAIFSSILTEGVFSQLKPMVAKH